MMTQTTQHPSLKINRCRPLGPIWLLWGLMFVLNGFGGSASALESVADTKFSVDRGFFTESFQLEITCQTPGTQIHYTLDGSIPNLFSGAIYRDPVTIDKTTTLRAIAYSLVPGSLLGPSNVDTQTYIFLDDVILQSRSSRPDGWPLMSINDQVFDYGMDPDIVNDARYEGHVTEALMAIPSISIVTDKDNLLDPTTGIYVNAYGDGIEWERPTSLELLNPDDSKGFQIDCGLRIRGGFSRAGSNPKHSFRLFFRAEYGDTKLRYPMFGDEGVKKFDNLDLRTAQNNSYAYTGSSKAAFNIDVFSRDTQRAMGQPYTRSRYYHVYLNGQYWGLYQSQERAEAAFAASYFGGEKEDYDVIKPDPSAGYKIVATDGVTFDYGRIWQAAVRGFEGETGIEAYYKLQGLNPDGTNNPDYDCLLNADNLIDYMLVIYYTSCWDGPIVMWDPPHRVNNFFSSYNRVNPEGFRFFCHDAENSLNDTGGNNLGPHVTGEQWTSFNPLWLHQQLMANDNYRMRFADHVRRFLFEDGILTPEAAKARFQARADEIDQAIIAETARWGDAHPDVYQPFTRDDHWLPAIQAKLDGFLSLRTDILLAQFKAKGWYPSIDAPTLNQNGGTIEPGFSLGMFSNQGTIYYTTDGSDPRQPDGTLNPAAVEFAGAANFTAVPNGGVWKYFDQGSNLGTAWREPGFNDAPWASGSAQLGYGDNDENTLIGYGPDPSNKYITSYFRRTFTISDLSAVIALNGSLLRDDGAVIYINGQEVLRANMPAGDVTFATPASHTAGSPEESTFTDFILSTDVLVEGENTMAVEVHQSGPGSTDLSFDLKLQYTRLLGEDMILLNTSTVLKTRAMLIQGLTTTWSALTEARFFVNTAAAPGSLAISEINYNPPMPTAAELAIDPLFTEDDFEFLELLNISGDVIDLGEVAFVEGIAFDFATAGVPTLEPGEHTLIVHNRAAFEARYGTGATLAGQFAGSLSNKGERLMVTGNAGQVIFDFEYDDEGDWPSRADGSGASLELEDPAGTVAGNYGKDGPWRSSSEYLGSPGRAGLGPLNQVVINEVLSHTDPPQSDSIELLNITDATIDLSGWCLSDSDNNLFKFAIDEGTALAPGEYVVFDEEDFNPSVGVDPNDFALNGAHGDDVWLMKVEPGGAAWFADHVTFDAAANGESFGRWPESDDRLYPMRELTLGSANAGPREGPLLISEIHYHAGDTPESEMLEFIEIANPLSWTASLKGWQIEGLGYTFPSGASVRRRATLVVVPFDPDDPLNAATLEAFRQAYGIDRTVRMIGPYPGSLANAGERIKLMRPDEPPIDEPTFTPYLIEDQVGYNDKAPWPEEADGAGQSLNRLGRDRFGDDPASWAAAKPTPGFASILPQTGVDDSERYE